MDRWFRLKIMTWKWIVLSKTGNRINLSYRHNFGFVVRKLTVLKSKVWILLYSNIPSRFLNCFEEFWGCFSSPILLDPVLIFTFLWVWVRLFLIFFFFLSEVSVGNTLFRIFSFLEWYHPDVQETCTQTYWN